MEGKRNLGVTEARFALTLLTCLLVAIGYITLLRLVGPKNSTNDIGSDDVIPPSVVGPSLTAPITELEPRVLPIEKPDDALAKRPLMEQTTPDPKLH